MSVIIRLQNLPWSANALDIRNYFRGLSIPEGGVHIVGGELGDAFIAFSTDEDARQAMMLDCGKIKEIQVKLLLSSRSEMHKVIETARQTVPILALTAPAPAPPAPAPPAITPFSAALGTSLSGFGIPGIGNPNEIPQPAVIEPPAPLVSPSDNSINDDRDDDKSDYKRGKEKDRRRSRTRSRSRDRDRKDRKRDRRGRSRSRERRRRDRSRSRDRRDRKRDRKDRSRSRERSERSSPRRSRDRHNDRKSPDKTINLTDDVPAAPPAPVFANNLNPANGPSLQHVMNNAMQIAPSLDQPLNRFADPAINDAYNKLSELGKKRNPNAFQGDQNGAPNRFPGGRDSAGPARGGPAFRRDGRSRFDLEPPVDCCVALRNAPNHTSYGDVRRFFPFLIDKHGIKMINDNTGRRTGNIFVRFCEPRSKQLALQRKNNELKGEPVSVEPLDDESYESAVDSFLPFRDEVVESEPPAGAPAAPATPPFSILRIAEMPHFVKEHDIIKMFSDFSLLSIMLNDCRLTRTKTAYVQFAKVDDARIAFERRERYAFGKRHPVITTVTEEEYEKEKIAQNEKIDFPQPMAPMPQEPPAPEPAGPRDPRQRRQFDAAPAPAPAPGGVPFFSAPFAQPPFPAGFPAQQFPGFPGPGALDPRAAAASWAARPPFPDQQDGQPDPEEELDCVLMKGLPCDATDRTIVTFLADTGAVPARIHLMLDASGVPSGDCFCEFRSTGEARRAAAKHGHNLEGCRVTVDPVPRGVVEEALEGPKPPEPRGSRDARDALLANPSNCMPYFESRGKRGGYRGRGAFDRGGFDRGGYDRGFEQPRGGYRGGFDQPRGSWSERGTRGGFDRGGRARGFERGRARGRGRGSFENGRDTREAVRQEEPDGTLEDFGAPGCVLSLENVPFRATVEDILGFFGDFELTQDDVIRRYNERGQPTGDARVAFRTPFDAQRALSTRSLGSIHERRISLALL